MTTVVYGHAGHEIQFMSALGSGWIPDPGWSGNTAQALTANRLYYIPYHLDYEKDVDEIGVVVTTGAGTNMRLGLYRRDPDGNPGDLLITSGDLNPSTTGLKNDSTFTTQNFDLNEYYIAIVSDGATALRATTASQQSGANALGVIASTFINGTSLYEDLGVWSALPATANATPTLITGFNPPRVCLHAA